MKANDDTDVEDMLNPQAMIQTATPMDRDKAIDTIINRLVRENYVANAAVLKEAVLAREAESTTALGMHRDAPCENKCGTSTDYWCT